MHIGLQIKTIRESKNITKEQMADWLGVCLNTYKSIEYCKRVPNLEEARLISEKLEIDPSTFFNKDNSTIINQGDYSAGIGNVIINDKELILSLKHTIDRLSEILEKIAK
jgi:transcriptional regulator with XRE-family HTH domain